MPRPAPHLRGRRWREGRIADTGIRGQGSEGPVEDHPAGPRGNRSQVASISTPSLQAAGQPIPGSGQPGCHLPWQAHTLHNGSGQGVGGDGAGPPGAPRPRRRRDKRPRRSAGPAPSRTTTRGAAPRCLGRAAPQPTRATPPELAAPRARAMTSARCRDRRREAPGEPVRHWRLQHHRTGGRTRRESGRREAHVVHRGRRHE
mmetsp:Transcript_16263/g.56747  ORF Transcript_16263/g.56747 Transcript_16263/m.56747 type:complete len:202 (+) Transcript_16263:325-930(+)